MTDKTNDGLELLPCPFCGSKAMRGMANVWCSFCGASTYDDYHMTKEQVIEAWNMRSNKVKPL